MRHHVVRQAGEDGAAGQVPPLGHGREVAEEQGLLARAVVGVGLAQGVGVDAQPPHEPIALVVVGLRPEDAPPQGPLEVADGGHGHGVDHLLMELGVPLGGIEPALSEQETVLQVDRRIAAAAGRIDVHHLQVLPHRSRRQVLPRHLEGHLIDDRRVDLPVQAGVEGVDAEVAKRRRALGRWLNPDRTGVGHRGISGNLTKLPQQGMERQPPEGDEICRRFGPLIADEASGLMSGSAKSCSRRNSSASGATVALISNVLMHHTPIRPTRTIGPSASSGSRRSIVPWMAQRLSPWGSRSVWATFQVRSPVFWIWVQ